MQNLHICRVGWSWSNSWNDIKYFCDDTETFITYIFIQLCINNKDYKLAEKIGNDNIFKGLSTFEDDIFFTAGKFIKTGGNDTLISLNDGGIVLNGSVTATENIVVPFSWSNLWYKVKGFPQIRSW